MRFAFRLASHLGKTVRQLCNELGQDEFTYWVAYHQIEPLPDPWLQTAIQTSATVNALGGKTKLKNFMPPRKVIHRPPTEVILSKIETFKIQYLESNH